MPVWCDHDEVVCIIKPRLPGGADMIIDDRAGSLVMWVRQGLEPEEVMARIACGCSEVARAHLWTRTPAAELRLKVPVTAA